MYILIKPDKSIYEFAYTEKSLAFMAAKRTGFAPMEITIGSYKPVRDYEEFV